MAQMSTEISTYADAFAFLRGQQSRKLGHNTFVEIRPRGVIAVRYHRTDILTYAPNGAIVLNTNGWTTSTTKLRFNAIVNGLHIWSEGTDKWGDPIWAVRSPSGERCRYEDGMVIDPDGSVSRWLQARWEARAARRQAS